MKNKTLLILSFLYFLHYCANGQTKEDKPNLATLILKAKINLGDAETIYQRDSLKLAKIYQLRSCVNELLNSFNQSTYIEDSNYIKLLASDIDLIPQMIRKPDQATDLLNYLIESFSLKIKFNALFGFHDNSLYHKLTVKIRVVQKNKDLQGYTIGCNTKFWFNRDPPSMYANGNISPTTIELPPGVYVFILLKDKFRKTFEHTIGGNQQQLQEITFSLD